VFNSWEILKRERGVVFDENPLFLFTLTLQVSVMNISHINYTSVFVFLFTLENDI